MNRGMSNTEYETIAAGHRNAIEQRGFSSVRQVGYSSTPVHRLWRRVRGRMWEGWKTYWHARRAGSPDVFVKASFGHDTLPPAQATTDAENEVMVHEHFRKSLGSVAQICMLDLIDHWRAGQAYFIDSLMFCWDESGCRRKRFRLSLLVSNTPGRRDRQRFIDLDVFQGGGKRSRCSVVGFRGFFRPPAVLPPCEATGHVDGAGVRTRENREPNTDNRERLRAVIGRRDTHCRTYSSTRRCSRWV